MEIYNNIQTSILFARAKLSFAQPKLWFAGIKLWFAYAKQWEDTNEVCSNSFDEWAIFHVSASISTAVIHCRLLWLIPLLSVDIKDFSMLKI